MKTIKILIVDDHSLYRKGIRAALEEQIEFEVVGEAGNGMDAITLASTIRPEIILMDLSMPGCNGLEATRVIKQQLPQTRIVILTVSDADDDLFEAVKCGAQGYVQKDVNAADLGAMLIRAAGGEALLSGLLAAKILKEINRSVSQPQLQKEDKLTDREMDVLAEVVNGCSNREIAAKLFISENTVKHHLTNILEKLHVNNRIQLAAYSVQHGLIK